MCKTKNTLRPGQVRIQGHRLLCCAERLVKVTERLMEFRQPRKSEGIFRIELHRLSQAFKRALQVETGLERVGDRYACRGRLRVRLDRFPGEAERLLPVILRYGN